MGILKNQTSARIILTTNIDLSSISILAKKIYYRKPSGSVGSWTATILSGGETTGDIYVDFSTDKYFDESGVWTLWSYLQFPDERTATGDKVEYTVES